MATLTVESENLDENVRIKKVETKEVETFVSVKELKQRIEGINNEIESLKGQHDEIVDQIIEIDADKSIKLTIKDIPTKLTLTK